MEETKEERARRMSRERVRKFRARRGKIILSAADSLPEVMVAKSHWESYKMVYDEAERNLIAARRNYLNVRRRASQALARQN